MIDCITAPPIASIAPIVTLPIARGMYQSKTTMFSVTASGVSSDTPVMLSNIMPIIFHRDMGYWFTPRESQATKAVMTAATVSILTLRFLTLR